MKPSATALALLLALGPAAATAGDWPQWRGPALDGSSAETGLPLEWGPEQNMAWKLPLPAVGGSSPIVTDDRVLLMVSYRPEESDAIELWCVDRASGGLLWKRRVSGGNVASRKHDMASPSPVTDGRRVWAMTGTGVLKGFDLDGTELWARDLQAEYGKFGLMWGYASSPLLHDGTLYVQVLHGMKTDDPSYVLAIDASSGTNRWRMERPTQARMESPDSYATPLVYEHEGRLELAISGGDAVTGHDPATGAELWRATVLNPEDNPSFRIVTTPIYAGGLLIASGKRSPLVALRPGLRGDVTATAVAWSHDRSTDVPSPVSDGQRLYLVTDKGFASAFDLATGKVVWGPERLETGTHSASPVLADGRIYAVDEDGVTAVFAAAAEYRPLARNVLEGFTLSSPAVSGGQFFIRTAKHLYAIGQGPGAPELAHGAQSPSSSSTP